MTLLRRLDAACGISLRWLANLVTGNYFKRLERELSSIRESINKVDAATAILRQIHDEQEYATLDRYKTGGRK